MATRGNRDPVSAAIAATERELMDEALGDENLDTDASDRSLEQKRDGLEGDVEGDFEGDQPEVQAKDGDADEADADKGEDGEGHEDGDEARDDKGRFVKKDAKQGDADTGTTRKEVPPARLREESTARRAAEERAKAVEAERDTARQQLAEQQRAYDAKMDLVLRQLQMQQQPQNQQQPKANQEPDMFADPEGWRAWNQQQTMQALAQVREESVRNVTNMNLAFTQDRYGEKFDAAYQAIIQAAQVDPGAKLEIQRALNSPNPGAAIMRWHRDRETLNLVGSDPEAYRKKVADETRAALLADPEFRKEMLAGLRSEGANGNARHVTRLPKQIPSLNGASGAGRNERVVGSGSEQELYDDAFAD